MRTEAMLQGPQAACQMPCPVVVVVWAGIMPRASGDFGNDDDRYGRSVGLLNDAALHEPALEVSNLAPAHAQPPLAAGHGRAVIPVAFHARAVHAGAFVGHMLFERIQIGAMDTGQRRLGRRGLWPSIDMEASWYRNNEDRGRDGQGGPDVSANTKRKDSKPCRGRGRRLFGGGDPGPNPLGEVGAGVNRRKRLAHVARPEHASPPVEPDTEGTGPRAQGLLARPCKMSSNCSSVKWLIGPSL